MKAVAEINQLPVLKVDVCKPAVLVSAVAPFFHDL
ncbi:conserved protein of unknown function [Pseudomonas marincola]|uniref:Uncharacterized protein n=1 Tax=Pseudomonas marincola TaxID=437900 RepID=A0A653E003_9PSED|nr:conserved protein of unknown function [Pseudomonas marincola]